MERHSPESPKRFAVSEGLAHERAHAVQTTIEEMRHEYPEITALSLFGSLVKGKMIEKSDIDAMLVVDPDMIEEKGEEQEPAVHFERSDFHSHRGLMRYESRFHWPELRNDLKEKYEGIFAEKVMRQLPALAAKQIEDIIVVPLNNALLEYMLDEIVDSYKKYPNGVAQNTLRFGHKTETDAEGKSSGDIRIEPSPILYMLFHLDVGGGLPPYRKVILDRLAAEGEVGEKIWNKLISFTESWEEKVAPYDTFPTDKHYPRTLTEAQRVYGR